MRWCLGAGIFSWSVRHTGGGAMSSRASGESGVALK